MVCEEFDSDDRGLFETEQIGQFYVVHGQHARGDTFEIQILPKGVKAVANGKGNLCLNSEAVLVYGQAGGISGWTDSYGWLIAGPWQASFRDLVKQRAAARHLQKKAESVTEDQRQAFRRQKVAEHLAALAAAWPLTSDRELGWQKSFFAIYTDSVDGSPVAVRLSDVEDLETAEDEIAIWDTEEHATKALAKAKITGYTLYPWSYFEG